MKIVEFSLYRYRLPLVALLKLGDQLISERTGFIVQLRDSSGNTAHDEMAPLPSFSAESLSDVARELRHIRQHLLGKDLPEGLERLDGGFDRLLDGISLSPSTRFGIESAVLSLIASHAGTTLAGLIGAENVDRVKVNALLSGTREEILAKAVSSVESGYVCCKLKIGGMTVGDAVNLTESVREAIGPALALRLDANRSFALEDAINLMRKLGPFDIEYVEEPAQNLGQLRKLLGEKGLSAGVALDESLREIRPEDLSSPYPIKAVVIKPTLLGLEKAYQFGRAARQSGIVPVVSSSFESSIGNCVLVALAASLGGADIAAGLDTLSWLTEDLVSDRLTTEGGCIALNACRPDKLSLRRDLLEEIALD